MNKMFYVFNKFAEFKNFFNTNFKLIINKKKLRLLQMFYLAFHQDTRLRKKVFKIKTLEFFIVC